MTNDRRFIARIVSDGVFDICGRTYGDAIRLSKSQLGDTETESSIEYVVLSDRLFLASS